MSEKFNINTIKIKSFRGIVDYELDMSEKSLVLCGENGSGKSSIANAFEYLFTGKVKSLSGTNSIKHNKSLINISAEKNDMSVEALIGEDKISRSFKDGFNYSENLQDLVDDFSNGSFILNRQKLLSFINTTPNARYKEINKIIGFEELDNIENTLRKTNKSLKKQYSSKLEELNAIKKEIEELYDCNIDDIYCEINKILEKNNMDLINEDSDLKEFLNNFSKKNFEEKSNLEELIKLTDIDILEIDNKYQELLSAYEDISFYQLKHSAKLLDILNNSNELISEEKLDKCPICQNNINYNDVINKINIKTEELELTNKSMNEWKKQQKSLISKLNDLKYNLNIIKSKLTDYAFDFNIDNLINDLKKLANFEIKLSDMDLNTLINLNEDFLKLKNDIYQNYENKNDDDSEKIYETILKLNLKKELEIQIEALKKEYEISKTTYELFSNKKQEVIENIINEIGYLMKSYYDFIHNNEDFNSPEIQVPKSTELSLGLNFKEFIADPRTYSSEGHLDSLGLCIFLAFVKKFNKYDFIILDDIIATVDLGHKERVASLLFSEFKDYKFIITTHNKLWFEQLSRISAKYGLKRKIDFVEIVSWKLEKGPKFSIMKTSKEKIEKYLDEGDIYAAGNSIRRYSEQVFIEVCKANEIRVPLKEHPSLREYVMSIRAHFNKTFNKDKEIKEQFKMLMDELEGNAYIGNLTSHENEINNDLTVGELENFRDTVYEFEKFMKCWEHDNYLKFDNDKKIALCKTKSCSYVFNFSGT